MMSEKDSISFESVRPSETAGCKGCGDEYCCGEHQCTRIITIGGQVWQG